MRLISPGLTMSFYAFPPFCMIPRTLHKITKEKASGILVVPDWPSQPWYPKLAKMLKNNPVLVSARENLLSLPQNPEEKHRLRKSLRLIICEVSERDLETLDFRNKLQRLSALHDRVALADCMLHTLQSGKSMRTEGTLIPFHRL